MCIVYDLVFELSNLTGGQKVKFQKVETKGWNYFFTLFQKVKFWSYDFQKIKTIFYKIESPKNASNSFDLLNNFGMATLCIRLKL
jgi:hypothetical protein